MSGWRMLLYKEVLRFWKVAFQTVAAPVLTSVLYMMIFGHVLEDHVKVYDAVPYTAFLLPGLIMMSILQNAFANSSSSLVQSKIMGNLVFLLLTPLSHWHWFVAYVGSSMLRGLAVGLGVFAVTVWFAPLQYQAPLWILAFAILCAGLLGAMGPVSYTHLRAHETG
jgi:ABC-2 type transport system permease protein